MIMREMCGQLHYLEITLQFSSSVFVVSSPSQALFPGS